MTKHSAQKKAARAYQQAHPGTRLADALRAVTRPQSPHLAAWAPCDVPWIRRTDGPAACYFCGNSTAIRSFTDMTADRGRVSVYCESGECDAREVEVLVVEDGTEDTRSRTDVRIMAHFEPMNGRPEWAGIGPSPDWAAGTPPYVRNIRGANETIGCLFCGEQTCTLSRNDVAADEGRVRLHCTNTRCRVREVEVLVMRDGTGWPAERPDVKALRALFPTRADQLASHLPAGEPAIFPVSDFHEPAQGVDPLAMRISGPIPWGAQSPGHRQSGP